MGQEWGVTVNGYIKLYRSMLDWEWFSDSNTLTVFLFCLLSANHKPNRWQGIEIKEGQFVTSIQSIKSKTKLSVKQVRTALNHLKSTNELEITGTNKYSLVTIVNWASYQSDDSQGANKGQTNGKSSQIINKITASETANKKSGETQTPEQVSVNCDGGMASNKANKGQAKGKQGATNKNDKNEKKYIYGEFKNVKLTNGEFEKLKSKFPDYQNRIEKLSVYVASTGKRYSSHYATILNWARKEEPEREVKKYHFKKA